MRGIEKHRRKVFETDVIFATVYLRFAKNNHGGYGLWTEDREKLLFLLENLDPKILYDNVEIRKKILNEAY